MLYDIIYNYLSTHLFNSEMLESYSSNILGVSTNLNEWLSHTITIALLIFGLIILIGLVKWAFNVFSGLFRKI